jgi:hypothetical protein
MVAPVDIGSDKVAVRVEEGLVGVARATGCGVGEGEERRERSRKRLCKE